jgi:hypothetical protein
MGNESSLRNEDWWNEKLEKFYSENDAERKRPVFDAKNFRRITRPEAPMTINPQTGEYEYQRVFNFKVKISKDPLLPKKKLIAENSGLKKLFWERQNLSKQSNFENNRNTSYSPSPKAKNPFHPTPLHLNVGF